MTCALRVMRIVLAAATAAICLLLCWQAIDIYLVGNSPENFSAPGVRIAPVYSREIVGARLGTIAPALLSYLVLVAAGLGLQAAAGEKSKPRAAFLAEDRLRALRGKVEQAPPEAEAERQRRRKVWLIAGAVILVCAAISGVYLLNPAHFASLDLELVVGQMVLHVAPWVAVGLAVAAAASVLNAQSVLREIDILKAAPQKRGAPEQTEAKKKPVFALRVVTLGAAIVFIVLGVTNGGLWDVLVKAINICTECIGLG